METNDFFKQDQLEWFMELKDHELPRNFEHTNIPVEKFVFEDIPF